MGTSNLRFFLAGMAAAVVLTTIPHSAVATSDNQAIESAIPLPEPADVTPPIATDVGVTVTAPKSDLTTSTRVAPAAITPLANTLITHEPENHAPAATLAAPDRAIAEKLRERAAGKFDRIFNSKKEHVAINAFYSARGYAPLWITDGAVNERAKAAITYLKGVEADGLDPSDYPIPHFGAGARPDRLAEAELRLTASVVTYTRHAWIGRVHFSRISADIYYNKIAPEPGKILDMMADVTNVREALDSFNPQHEGYKALKAKLAEARASKGDAGSIRIDGGPVLKFGKVHMQDPRVPRLRMRLGISGAVNDATYDKALADAVAKFQRQRGLTPNGHLSRATVNALNGSRGDHDADIIIANMERWRWLPRDLGKVYVILNIPDFTLKVVNNGVTAWTTKVVVGKPSTPTPIFSDTMKSITVNPTWNVPPSIVYNEYLPALQQDPRALDRIGLKLVQKRDGGVHIYQPPGERNALGRIRFNFPNKFLVYQHDTPDKYLFAQESRAYSHGCMRVQDPIKYAELLLSIVMPKGGYTQDRIRKMFGSTERDIQLSTPIPVHTTYQTAFVDAADKLVIRKDIYSHDTRVLAALNSDEPQIAGMPIERPQPNYSRTPVRLPDGYAYPVRDRSSFLERLFDGPAVPQASID